MKNRVTGLGGVFFKANNPPKLKEWYGKHLGFSITDYGATFHWIDQNNASSKTLARTEWGPFAADTKYFDPSEKAFMFNYRVADLENLLETLQKEGIESAGKVETYPYGKFGWIMDPERNKIELWEPIDEGFGPESTESTQTSRIVTGIGGIFFKADDPEKLGAWYRRHLGIEGMFQWIDSSSSAPARTIWSAFQKETDYFSPSEKAYMFNYRVKNLAETLDILNRQGIPMVGKTVEYPYGKFGWVMDPEGNKIELWEPVDERLVKL